MAFPQPLDALATDAWSDASAELRAAARSRLEQAQDANSLAALLTDPDPVVRASLARALASVESDGLSSEAATRVQSLKGSHASAILDALERETDHGAGSGFMASVAQAASAAELSQLLSDGRARLKAVAVLDPSDRKRWSALDALLETTEADEPTAAGPEWLPEFLRERMLSDDSNFVRASLAARLAVSPVAALGPVREFAVQWLKHTDIAPTSAGAALDAIEKQDDYFASERRSLLADDLGVRTTRSRADGSSSDHDASSTRRAGPTLVQGHHNEAGPLVKVQRIAAALAAVVGAWFVIAGDGRAGLGAVLLGVAVVWAILLQLWKWYRYG